MVNPKGVNIRYCAAGYLSAAGALIAAGHDESARIVLAMVDTWINHPDVNAPPQLKTMLTSCIEAPRGAAEQVFILESWFVDPFNTVIENSGERFQ